MLQSSKRQASFNRLATGHISTRRSDILLAATDTFCNQQCPKQAQIGQYRELFYSLISETDEISKRLISSSLAKHQFTPRPILLYFALETAAIAAPILAYAKGLGQFDLMQIIDKTSCLHHRVIANRKDIGITVVNRLKETGDNLTLRRLIQNSAIAEMDSTQGTHNADYSLEMMPPVAEAVPVDPAQQQFSSSEAIADPNTQSKVTLALDELVALTSRGKKLGSIDDLLQNTPSLPQPDFGKILLEATNRKDRQGQISAIRNKFGLSATIAVKIFEDHSGDTLSVLLKAGNLENQVALQIITQTLPNVGLSDHNTKRVSRIYPALDAQICRATVYSWRRKTSQTPPQ